MKKFKLDESEIKRILSMHRVLKEQTAPATPEAPKAPEVDPSLKKLRDAEKDGCFLNGKIYHNKTKNTYYYRAVQQNTKQEIDFYPDMTYSFVDGSKKGRWKCDNITKNAAKASEESTKMQASNTQKTAFINMATDLGYKENLTPEEIASGEYKKYIVPGSQEIFPPNGIEMWYSQTDVASSAKTSTDTFDKISKAQTINKSLCKEAIKSYYEAYKTKKDIPQAIFDRTKKVVQSCVNTYEGKWGGLLGLGRIKDYVETLRNEPSRRGTDSKWRLN